MHQIGVSILNFEAAMATVLCVRSLLDAQAQDGEAYSLQIHIADNGSSRDDFRSLREGLTELPGVNLHRHEKNLGFSAGHNRNIGRMIQGQVPEYVWLLNNDCVVYAQTPQSLLHSALECPDVDIWGSTLIESDGKTVQCAGGCLYRKWLSSFHASGRGCLLEELDSLKDIRFDYIAGASMFMPIATLQERLELPPGRAPEPGHHWLNEEYFLYFEELDLAQRLRGGAIMDWCRRSMVRHAGGAGTGTSLDGRTKLAEYHSTLSALKFTRTYFPKYLAIMMPALFLGKVIQLSLTGHWRLLPMVCKAYVDFMSGQSRDVS